MNAAACFVALAATLGAAPAVTLAPPTLVDLSVLVGTWEARTPSGGTIKASHRWSANNTVLVQTYVTASGKETLTLFHADGPTLMAVHYCAQGNQPRLVLQAASTPAHLVFVFRDATNLPSPAAAHLVRLEVTMDGPDAYTLVETYEEKGKPDHTTLRFQRVR